jgi:hypothetical protein
MKLFEHPDFTQAILQAAEHFRNQGLRPAIIAVGSHPALTFVEKESQTIGEFGRNDRFSYAQHFAGPSEVANRRRQTRR